MINQLKCYCILPSVLLVLSTPLISADYSMNIQLSSERANEGGNVTATCDVISQQANSAMTVVWMKRTVEGEEVEIGTDKNITDKFQKTLRYTIREQKLADPKHVRFTLTINNLKSGDSGEIGCSIPSHRIHIFKAFTVLVPVKSVRLRSRDIDKSRADAYYDQQNVSFPDGAIRQFFCDVSGSFPQPEVTLLIGDRDITSDFNKTDRLIYEGPANLKGVQAMHYETDLSHPNLHIGFAFGGKTMSCIAKVPHSTYPAVSSSVFISFLSYRPKFIDCSESVVKATLYQKNLRFECDVQAVPAVTDVRVKYDRRILRAGSRDGHYRATLIDQSTKSSTMKRLIFSIDNVYPQHFRNYTIVAMNGEGETHLSLQIVRDPQVAALSEASCLLHSLSTLVTLILLALLIH